MSLTLFRLLLSTLVALALVSAFASGPASAQAREI